MLELIDLSPRLSRDEYKRRLPALRTRLLQLQQTCWREAIPSILVFEGWDAAGKGDVIRKVTERLEPRGYEVHYVADTPRTYALDLPWMWRFWLAAPAHGEMAIFDRSWNRRALVNRVKHGASELDWRRSLRDIGDFERMMADDGTLFIKLFFHISKKEQKKRYGKWAKDPATSWRMRDKEWLSTDDYQPYLDSVEELLEVTDAAWSPWKIIAATDRRYARVQAFESVIDHLEDRLTNRGVVLPEPWKDKESPAEPASEEPVSMEAVR